MPCYFPAKQQPPSPHTTVPSSPQEQLQLSCICKQAEKSESKQHLKKYLGPPWARMALLALAMLGREAAVHIMVVLITSRGVVAAAAKAPLTAPIAKSSCSGAQMQ